MPRLVAATALLRAVAAVIALALSGAPAAGQEEAADSSGAEASPVRSAYPAAPAGIEPPAAWTIEAVRAARGNLARWRDAERRRLGAYSWDIVGRGEERRLNVENAISEVGGYFAFFGDAIKPAGLVEGTWRDPMSEAGKPSTLRGAYVHPYSICNGAIDLALAALDDATYLGAEWRAEFDALDEALGGPPGGRATGGRTLPAGVTGPTLNAPSMVRDVARFYPRRALEGRQEGRATLSCLVQPRFNLHCATASEDPPGWEFGDAALRVFGQSSVRVTGATSDGQSSVGLCVRTSVRFQTVR
jgi:hypothetical protein